MKVAYLFLLIIIFLTAGCAGNLNREGSHSEFPEISEVYTPERTTESEFNNTGGIHTPEVEEQTPEKETPVVFSPKRNIVLKDSKSALQSTSDNLFVIYHGGGDSIPFINTKIIVSENGETIDELTFNTDASFFKGRYDKLKSSILRDNDFEEGDEIIIVEKPGFNLESGEIVNVKIIDLKWNLTVLDSFVQVW